MNPDAPVTRMRIGEAPDVAHALACSAGIRAGMRQSNQQHECRCCTLKRAPHLLAKCGPTKNPWYSLSDPFFFFSAAILFPFLFRTNVFRSTVIAPVVAVVVVAVAQIPMDLVENDTDDPGTQTIERREHAGDGFAAGEAGSRHDDHAIHGG